MVGAPPISIMLVDDAAVVRGMLTQILKAEADFDIIKSVSDGKQAVEALADIQPDIILLDVEMPIMDGMTALPKILEASPESRVVMCSTLTVRNAGITLDALRIGATECIGKPTSPTDIKVGGEFQQNLVNIIRGLGKIGKTSVRPASTKPASSTAPNAIQSTATVGGASSFSLRRNVGMYTGIPKLLAIGSSTGGPQALFKMMSHLKDFPIPIVVTQHMPATFTKILAQHITTQTGVTAIEAEEDMILENGIAYVAPGGFHMLFEKDAAGRTIVKLDNGPAVNFCKPAVDPMLDSAVKIYGQKILCAILTGMGHDGMESAKSLSELGGRIIAQDEATSVVWGMPGAVAVAGICSEVLPIDDIGPYLSKAIKG